MATSSGSGALSQFGGQATTLVGLATAGRPGGLAEGLPVPCSSARGPRPQEAEDEGKHNRDQEDAQDQELHLLMPGHRATPRR